jgi:MBG domain (YGX type)
LTFIGANLSVTAAPLTVTADAQSRAYGAVNPALSYGSSGLVNGDTLLGDLTTIATTTSNVGAYAITQGTLAASTNYALSYVGANLTVTAAPLTVTANAQSRLYGAANPALIYASSGLLNGDTLSGGLATTATTISNVGSFGITQGSLADSNYAIAYLGAQLTVTAAPLRVTANAQSRLDGTANPTLSYGSLGLVNGDTLSGLLATSATASSNVGAYAITQGTLVASANYTLSYVGANLTVTAAPLAVTADAQGAAFPSYFTSNDFFRDGGNENNSGFAPTNSAINSNASTCTPAAVLQRLNRDGRVDLTGVNTASCLLQMR